MSVYTHLKKYGIKVSQIVLAAPNSYVCDPRNRMPGFIIYQKYIKIDSFWPNIYEYPEKPDIYIVHIDFRGKHLNQNKIINLIKGRFGQHETDSQRI